MAKTHRIVTTLFSGCLLLAAAFGCNRYEDTGVNTVRQQKGDLQACISDASARNPALKGQVHEMDLIFEIAPDGSVAGFSIAKDQTRDPGFNDCLNQRARSWRFPAPPSGKAERFGYKFNAHF